MLALIHGDEWRTRATTEARAGAVRLCALLMGIHASLTAKPKTAPGRLRR